MDALTVQSQSMPQVKIILDVPSRSRDNVHCDMRGAQLSGVYPWDRYASSYHPSVWALGLVVWHWLRQDPPWRVVVDVQG